MSFKSTVLAAAAAIALAVPAFSSGVMVEDAYARASSMMSTSGAAFMMIVNQTGQDDRLIDATSPVADKVELHTHREDANGVMRMIHVEEGFALPKDGQIALQRGGHHVMFLGLKQPFAQRDMIPLTLIFENAGAVEIEVPVDMERSPMRGEMNQGEMKQHGADMQMSN